MKLRLPIRTVRSVHAYTRSHLPWRLDTCEEEDVAKKGGHKFGRKLYHYISGGGMESFGRSVRQEEANVRRNHFLIASGIVGVIWFCFLVF